MSLQDLIRRKAPASGATAIPAIRATRTDTERGTVAEIATVAVARPTSAEVGPAGRVESEAPSVRDCDWQTSGAGSGTDAHEGPELGEDFEPLPTDTEDAGNGLRLQGEVGERHAARLHRFLLAGLAPARAEAAADLLTARDADSDDRRMCVECSHYGTRGRCIAAASGRLPGAASDLQPVPDLLQRCEAFGLRKGLE